MKNVKRILWLSVFVILTPFWIALYLMGLLGFVVFFLWDNTYHPMYKLAGSPFDKK